MSEKMITKDMLKQEIFNSFISISQRFKVLLIDDENQSRVQTQETLKINDFLIENVSTVEEAIQQIKEDEFDFVMIRPRLLNSKDTMLIRTKGKRSKSLPVVIAHRCVSIGPWQESFGDNAQSVIELPLNEKGMEKINRLLLNNQLSLKEKFIVELYAKGIKRKQAAEMMNMSEHTYAWYLKVIKRRLGIEGRQQMVALEALLKE